MTNEVGICKGCRHVRFNSAIVGCELGLKTGIMLECEGYVSDKQRVQVIERTKELMVDPK